jgi:hypothetical protein
MPFVPHQDEEQLKGLGSESNRLTIAKQKSLLRVQEELAEFVYYAHLVKLMGRKNSLITFLGILKDIFSQGSLRLTH